MCAKMMLWFVSRVCVCWTGDSLSHCMQQLVAKTCGIRRPHIPIRFSPSSSSSSCAWYMDAFTKRHREKSGKEEEVHRETRGVKRNARGGDGKRRERDFWWKKILFPLILVQVVTGQDTSCSRIEKKRRHTPLSSPHACVEGVSANRIQAFLSFDLSCCCSSSTRSSCCVYHHAFPGYVFRSVVSRSRCFFDIRCGHAISSWRVRVELLKRDRENYLLILSSYSTFFDYPYLTMITRDSLFLLTPYVVSTREEKENPFLWWKWVPASKSLSCLLSPPDKIESHTVSRLQHYIRVSIREQLTNELTIFRYFSLSPYHHSSFLR